MTVEDQITDYLSNGGLFNPEMMNHEQVRDLLMVCRDEISRLKRFETAALQVTTRATLDHVATHTR